MAENPLSLAVAAWFVCDGCNTAQTFPSILNHGCRIRLKGPRPDRSEWQDVMYSALLESAHRLDKYKGGIQRLQKAIIAYGLDPKTATPADMDSSPVRLKCVSKACKHIADGQLADGVREIMTWRVAVSGSCIKAARSVY